jgi:MFS family permease
MSNTTPQPGRFALAAAGAAFLGFVTAVAWTVVTMIAAGRAADRTQNETIGLLMIFTVPIAGLLAAIAGFVAGYVGERAQWPRRWAIVGVTGVLLAVGFNAYLLQTTGPDSRPHARAPRAP